MKIDLSKLFKENIKYLVKSLLLWLSILITIYLLIYHIYTSNKLKTNLMVLKKTDLSLINTESSIYHEYFDNAISDLSYLASCMNDSHTSDMEHQKNHWVLFSQNKKVYDQIRFIDASGYEVIRINNSGDKSFVVDEQDLQYKGNRYYFNRTLLLKEGDIYISDIDLNVENGEIEFPLKPVVRLSTPIYENMQLKGVLILNYKAQDFLNKFKDLAYNSNTDVYLINRSGNYLSNPESKKEWSFMFSDSSRYNFSSDFPEAWKWISSTDEGQFVLNNKIYTHRMLHSVDSSDSAVIICDSYKVVSVTSLDSSINVVPSGTTLFDLTSQKNQIALVILILLSSTLIAILLTLNKLSKDKVKYFAEFDSMTGIYNRRAGLEKIDDLIKESKTFSKSFSLCFLDINGLKKVNDTLGHEAGDDLITTSVDIIKKNIRSEDLIIRLGGDEFLLVFKDKTADEAENFWSRILVEINKLNDTGEKAFIISISHGISEYIPVNKSHIDSLINDADKKMYDEKRILKQKIDVIR